MSSTSECDKYAEASTTGNLFVFNKNFFSCSLTEVSVAEGNLIVAERKEFSVNPFFCKKMEELAKKCLK